MNEATIIESVSRGLKLNDARKKIRAQQLKTLDALLEILEGEVCVDEDALLVNV